MKEFAGIPRKSMSPFELAIQKAQHFEGATAPNPPVGAVALDRAGKVLSVGAHERAGTAHAEAQVIADLKAQGLLDQATELWVTLEPCNHRGRTPPCTDAILGTSIRRVVYGQRDPNPHVAGGGAERLRSAGLEVHESQDPQILRACRELILPFAHHTKTGHPWVLVKTALDPQGSMIPPQGQKTFTSQASLKFAHELRRRSDAILTGSGTILADHPEFTVRHVEDHPLVSSGIKRRKLVVLDRRGRTPRDWIQRQESLGFEVWIRTDLEASLVELGKVGVLQVLVEAGPELSSAILQRSLWNRHVLITQGNPDTVTTRDREP